MRPFVFSRFLAALFITGGLTCATASAAETAPAAPANQANDKSDKATPKAGEKADAGDEKAGQADLDNVRRGIEAIAAALSNFDRGVSNEAEIAELGEEMDEVDVDGLVQEAGAPQAISDAVVEVEGGEAAGVDPNIGNLERQLGARFQTMLQLEIAFAKRVCGLNQAQSELLAAAAKDSLKKVVKEAVDQQKLALQGRGGGMVSPQKRFQAEVAALVKAKLTREQTTRYEQELAKRAEYHKQAAVANLIVMMDDELLLTAEQRSKLTESLSSNWQEQWVRQLEVLVYGSQFFPKIPTKFILPYLRPAQQSAWQNVGQGDRQIFFNEDADFGIFPGVQE